GRSVRIVWSESDAVGMRPGRCLVRLSVGAAPAFSASVQHSTAWRDPDPGLSLAGWTIQFMRVARVTLPRDAWTIASGTSCPLARAPPCPLVALRRWQDGAL